MDRILGADPEYLKERKTEDNFGMTGRSLLWNISIEKDLKSPGPGQVKEKVLSSQKPTTLEDNGRENLQERVSK